MNKFTLLNTMQDWPDQQMLSWVDSIFDLPKECAVPVDSTDYKYTLTQHTAQKPPKPPQTQKTQKTHKPKTKRTMTRRSNSNVSACRQCYLAKVKCDGKRPCSRCSRLSNMCVERLLTDGRPTKKRTLTSSLIPWSTLRPDVASLFQYLLNVRLRAGPTDMAELAVSINQAYSTWSIPLEPCIQPMHPQHGALIKEPLKESFIAMMAECWTSCPPSCNTPGRCGDDNLVQMYCNPAWEALFGYTLQEVCEGVRRDGDLFLFRLVKASSYVKVMRCFNKLKGSCSFVAINKSGREFPVAFQWSASQTKEPPHLTKATYVFIPLDS